MVLKHSHEHVQYLKAGKKLFALHIWIFTFPFYGYHNNAKGVVLGSVQQVLLLLLLLVLNYLYGEMNQYRSGGTASAQSGLERHPNRIRIHSILQLKNEYVYECMDLK
jgi:hypothetical protein